jgi:hypothetical protein
MIAAEGLRARICAAAASTLSSPPWPTGAHSTHWNFSSTVKDADDITSRIVEFKGPLELEQWT